MFGQHKPDPAEQHHQNLHLQEEGRTLADLSLMGFVCLLFYSNDLSYTHSAFPYIRLVVPRMNSREDCDAYRGCCAEM